MTEETRAAPPSREGPELDRNGNPRIYPCSKCPTMRSAPEGGTTFTVCDECWDAVEGKDPSTRRPTLAQWANRLADAATNLRTHPDPETIQWAAEQAEGAAAALRAASADIDPKHLREIAWALRKWLA